MQGRFLSRPAAAVALAVALLVGLSAGACTRDGLIVLDAGDAISIVTDGVRVSLGEREELLANGALGLHYFPDQGVVPLARAPELRLIVVSKMSSWILQGPDVRSLGRAREVLRPGPPGSFDNGYAGIGGVYRGKDGRLFAFYHAEDHEDMGRLSGLIPGYYAAVGSAVSDDGGESWEKLGPVVTSAKPKAWMAYDEHHARGAGLPTAVVDPEGRYVLLYYNEQSLVDGRGTQVFVARADLEAGEPRPGRFTKYFEGAFSEPGLGGRETPVVSARDRDDAQALQPFVVYSEALARYVMIVHLHFWKELQSNGVAPTWPGRNSGIYVCFSEDGVAWSEPERLLTDRTIPVMGHSLSWEAGLLFDPDSGQRGWLLYGYSDRWGHTLLGTGVPHAMVGRRIEFEPATATSGRPPGR